MPYALKTKVEEELDRLTAEGFIESRQFADRAAAIVPVLKGDQTVRIGDDFKQTINQASKLDKYPIPRIEDILAGLAGGTCFLKLYLSSKAYLQVPLDDEAQAITVINTHKGLYQFNRLPYGVSSAPGIFQRVMESVLQGIPVMVYLDDILMAGKNKEEHLNRLDVVLQQLQKAGL